MFMCVGACICMCIWIYGCMPFWCPSIFSPFLFIETESLTVQEPLISSWSRQPAFPRYSITFYLSGAACAGTHHAWLTFIWVLGPKIQFSPMRWKLSLSHLSTTDEKKLMESSKASYMMYSLALFQYLPTS